MAPPAPPVAWANDPANAPDALAALRRWAATDDRDLAPHPAAEALRAALRSAALVAPDSFRQHAPGLPPGFLAHAANSPELADPGPPLILAAGDWLTDPDAPPPGRWALTARLAVKDIAHAAGGPPVDGEPARITLGRASPYPAGELRIGYDGRTWTPAADRLPFGWLYRRALEATLPDGSTALAAAFDLRPRRDANTRNDRLLPAPLVHAPAADRRAGRRFPAALYSPDGSRRFLPGFGPAANPDLVTPALPLGLYDLGLGSVAPAHRGQAAPLALRLWIEAILSVPDDRRTGGRATVSRPLRDWLAALYAPGYYRPHKHAPALFAAIWALDDPAARVPWELPDGSGGLRRVVTAWDIPRSGLHLDDHLSLEVNLPPGSGPGPLVERDRLHHWGRNSAAAFRLLLSLYFDWFDPGRARTPPLTPRGRRDRRPGAPWSQSADPDRYPRRTLDQLVARAFPVAAKTDRLTLRKYALRALRRLTDAGDATADDGRDGLRILPPDRLLGTGPKAPD